MDQKKPTVIDRVNALEDWIQPQRIESYKSLMRDRNSAFYHASVLFFTLQHAARYLNDLTEEFAVNPLRAINGEPVFRNAIEVHFLLERFEKWMKGEQTAEQLVDNTFLFCKNRVMEGDLTRLNYTCPIQNAVNTWTNNVYCGIMRTINQSVLHLQKERDDEAKDPKKQKALAKQRPATSV